MIVLEVCKEYGWSYADYLTNPNWFNELATERLFIDRKPRKTPSTG
jgi:hypothetical protein